MISSGINEPQAAPGTQARSRRRGLSLWAVAVAGVVAVATAVAVVATTAGAQARLGVDSASVAAVEPIGVASEEARFVELINELRRSEGLGELEVDVELVAGAHGWTEQLIADGGLSHAADLSVGVSSYWLKLGENVGVAPEGEIEALFAAFVASPTHYANLVDPAFTHVGVAVHHDGGRMWTTHRFMHLEGSAAADE